ncbi:MAG: hypothetical protein J6V69_04980 [Clostridia bacterium]|nr:hypothetical protein [Clostridia bacterium]
MNKLLLKKSIKIVAIVLVSVFVTAGAISIGLWEYAKDVYAINQEENLRYQAEHMDYLKNEFYLDYAPKGEQAFCDFNLDEALESGVKYNEVAFLATHNSYQRLATDLTKEFQIPFRVLALGLKNFNKNDFENDTLTAQFEMGIRSIEIDVEAKVVGDATSFVVMHKPVFDSATTCLDFGVALEEIVMWSNHNPNHLPISIIIESKQDVAPLDNLKIFDVEHAVAFDNLLKEKLGEKLITPADMLGTYSNFKEMRESDGWMTLKDMLGKVIVILHENKMTEDYVAMDETMRTQAMFPSLLYKQRDRDYASFIIDNNPKKTVQRKETFESGNYIVRTRADSYPKYSDERYALAERCGSQIITTDYCPRSVRNNQHTYSFNGYTVKLL